jgi:nitrate reductase assembly molybdenum cofactor insertion protein NarJ
MATNVAFTEGELKLAREAAEWRLLSLLFECPRELWKLQISALAQEVADPDLKSAVEHGCQEADEGLFHYAFGPGGPAPVREATYHLSVELGYLMSELQAFYNAFAFRPRTAEAPDHVSVEVGFVAYLKLKKLFALRCGDENAAATASESTQRFVQEHLANIAQPLSDRLQESGITYLAKAASALSRRVGPPITVTTPFPILQNDESEEHFACGPFAHPKKGPRPLGHSD